MDSFCGEAHDFGVHFLGGRGWGAAVTLNSGAFWRGSKHSYTSSACGVSVCSIVILFPGLYWGNWWVVGHLLSVPFDGACLRTFAVLPVCIVGGITVFYVDIYLMKVVLVS